MVKEELWEKETSENESMFQFKVPVKLLGGSLSNGDNIRAPIQFRRKRQSQHFKR